MTEARRAFPDPALPRGPGRRALVTGANRGLGRAIALGLALIGYRVWVGARERRAGEAVVAELQREGRAAELLVLDVTDEASLERARSVLGSLDVLVN
ncbi:MAG: SDR family NAD(P)-dependent oxidoreductase, partial [Candidatus Eisenbacteria bacterium]